MGVYTSLVKSNEPSAKKRFGQHFLRDTGVLDRIVRWIQPDKGNVFLEIGAGRGALSTRLAEHAQTLLAIEVDRDCIPILQESLDPFKSAKIISADVLQLDLAEIVSAYLHPDQKLRIVGNLPYNIATAIIYKMLHSRLPIEDMFFMVQLEVAERITANPGTKQYGYLSVDCQHYSDVRLGFKVSSACFVPRPKVSSAMISLHPKPHSQVSVWETHFEKLCKAAFSYRRKTLENALRRNPQFAKISESLLAKAGVDGSRRAEQLSVQEYEQLATLFHEEFANSTSA
jgi:16S rRNA (adenine1518-N6/adenine1519-N6)-dimethyltransferase